MVDGGVWRRPGPSLSARDGLEGIGRRSGEMTSPGSMSICVAIGRGTLPFSRVASCLETWSISKSGDCWESMFSDAEGAKARLEYLR